VPHYGLWGHDAMWYSHIQTNVILTLIAVRTRFHKFHIPVVIQMDELLSTTRRTIFHENLILAQLTNKVTIRKLQMENSER
jgi:hypothetical protein